MKNFMESVYDVTNTQVERPRSPNSKKIASAQLVNLYLDVCSGDRGRRRRRRV